MDSENPLENGTFAQSANFAEGKYPNEMRNRERGCSLDDVQDFVELAIPSASISENDLSEDVERKQKETKRKRQLLAFIIICVLVIGGVIIEKIKF
jgi:hypothetical protein